MYTVKKMNGETTIICIQSVRQNMRIVSQAQPVTHLAGISELGLIKLNRVCLKFAIILYISFCLYNAISMILVYNNWCLFAVQ